MFSVIAEDTFFVFSRVIIIHSLYLIVLFSLFPPFCMCYLELLVCSVKRKMALIYRQDYARVDEQDPFLPPSAASQAIAARTLRNQGSYNLRDF